MSGLLEKLEQSARDEAIRLQHPYIRSEHLLLALIQQDASILPVSYKSLFARLAELPAPACGAEQKLVLAQGVKRALNLLGEDAPAQEIVDSILQSSPLLRRILNEITEADYATSD